MKYYRIEARVPVVKRISRQASDLLVGVRILPGTQKYDRIKKDENSHILYPYWCPRIF